MGSFLIVCNSSCTLLILIASCSKLLPFASSFCYSRTITQPSISAKICKSLRSNFFDDFEDFVPGEKKPQGEKEEEDGDDILYMTEEDKARIELFRSEMRIGAGSVDDDQNQERIPPNPDFDLSESGEDDDEDDDDDEENDINTQESSIGEATFTSVDDLIAFAAGGQRGGKEGSLEEQQDWATPLLDPDNFLQSNAISSVLKGGVVLIANPEKFCPESDTKQQLQQPSPSLLSKFGLTVPIPLELGPDRRADLLPVLILLERHPLRGSRAVLLNRRTGYLLGDLENNTPFPGSSPSASTSSSFSPYSTTPPAPKLGAFMIQPLWFGGTSAGINTSGGGLDMLHQCPSVQGCQRLTDDGLFWGGDIMQAQEAMMTDTTSSRPLTGFDFKFFVQSTRWLPTSLEKEVRDGTWFVASVSKEVLFKPRDRLGTMRAKPLWTEIMELMGGKFLNIRNMLYDK